MTVSTPPSAAPTRRVPGEFATLLTRYGLPGLLGSTLVAVGAVVVGWLAPASPLMTDPFLRNLRDAWPAGLLAKIVVAVGAALLLATWLRLSRAVTGLSVAGARRLGGLVAVWSAPLLIAPVLFSRDVFSYIALSRLMPAGIDPYLFGSGALPTYLTDGVDPLWANSPAPYGPAWMGISSLVFHVTGAQPTAALVAFRLLAVLGVALMIWFLPSLAAANGADPGRAVWIAVLNPVLLFHFVSAGHNDALMIGLMIAGLALVTSHRPLWGIALIIVAGAIKSPALLALPFAGLIWAGPQAGWGRRIRLWAVIGLAAAAAFLLLGLATGLDQSWLLNITTPTKVRTWLSVSTALGLIVGAPLNALGLADPVTVLAAVRTIGSVLALGVYTWLVLTPNRRSPMRGLGLGLLVIVVLGPVFQPWYLLWALPALAAAGLSRRDMRAAVWLTALAALYTLSNNSATAGAGSPVPDAVAAAIPLIALLAIVVWPHSSRAALVRPDRDEGNEIDLAATGGAVGGPRVAVPR